jgi:bacterioferritin-associated ferredoxin
VPVTNNDGVRLGEFPVVRVRTLRQFSHTLIVQVQVPAEHAAKVAGIQLTAGWASPAEDADHYLDTTEQETIVCRCEHVSVDTIRTLIQNGVRDINQLKAASKATMGSCGGKTCLPLIMKLFREEGIPPKEITAPVQRPVFVEVPVSVLARNTQED